LAHKIAPGDVAGRKQALGLLSLLIGGVALARSTGSSTLSAEILEAARSLAYAALDVEPSKPGVEGKPAPRSRGRS